MTIQENKSLRHDHTFGIEVSAKYFVEINSVEEFRQLQEEQIYQNQERLILGGGSNVLFTHPFPGLVIRNNIQGIEVVHENDKTIFVKAGAGVVWHELVLWSISRNLGGIENLSLIPGRVGAAPMQNIGAYGVELKDVFEELEALHFHSGEAVTFKNTNCGFGYRESLFKNKHKNEFLISSVTLRLSKLDNPQVNYPFKTDYGDIKATLADMHAFDLTVKAVSDAVIKIRSSKLPNPKEIGNAGSFFKNPVIPQQQYEALASVFPVMPSYPQKDGTVKIPAGWLIEQSGWKGKRVGNTGCHNQQALVLVNYGNATGKEIVDLAKNIQISVHEKFGIGLLPEVNII